MEKCKIKTRSQLLEHYRNAETNQMPCSKIKSLHFSVKKDTLSQKRLFIIKSAYVDDHVNFQSVYETGSCHSVIH